MRNLLTISLIIFSIYPFNVSSQNMTWQKVLLFTDNCVLYKAQQTSDDGYIAVGSSSVGIRSKIVFIKFDKFGDTLWSKYFDLNVNSEYRGYWIEETIDKGFIISGSGPNSNAYLIKTNSLGNIQWYRTFAGVSAQARCVKQLEDKGYILLINTTDILVIRTDSLGNKIWSKIYGGNNFAEYAMEIEAVRNFGFILTGTVRPGHENLYLLRLDNNGDTLWSRTFTDYLSSEGFSIDISNDKGYIIGGVCDSLDNNNKKSYVIKTDSLGKTQWQRRYTTNYNEWCYSIRKLRNSGYVFCGTSDSLHQSFERAIIRVIDDNGNTLREKYYRPGFDEHTFYSVDITNDNGFIACGFAQLITGTFGHVVRTDSLLNIKPVGIYNNAIVTNNFALFQNYPNPFNPNTIINYKLGLLDGKVGITNYVTLKVYNVLGIEVATLVNERQNAGSYNVNFDARSFTSGIYFYQLSIDGNIVDTKRMVLLK